MKYEIYVGLNDKVTKKQEITTETALQYVYQFLADNTEGATVSLVNGIYKHEDGTVVIENTIKIELVYLTFDKVKKIIEVFKQHFNQESIMLVKVTSRVDFM